MHEILKIPVTIFYTQAADKFCSPFSPLKTTFSLWKILTFLLVLPFLAVYCEYYNSHRKTGSGGAYSYGSSVNCTWHYRPCNCPNQYYKYVNIEGNKLYYFQPQSSNIIIFHDVFFSLSAIPQLVVFSLMLPLKQFCFLYITSNAISA